MPATLLQMMTGYWVSQALYVSARLRIADLLVDGPRDVAALAAAAGADPAALYRVLRALASVGVFTETSRQTFALTPLADLLRSDVPGSMRALALLYADEQYRAWEALLHSVQTGTPAFDQRFGMPYFDYLAQHAEADAVFNAAMTGWSNQVARAVAESYDFSGLTTIVDVGGGYGALLTSILLRTPSAQGVLFDQPHVIDNAIHHLDEAGIAGRCTAVGGDFFAAVPAGGDAYVLAQILHDWDDERSVAILSNIRRVMPQHGKLLVVELVIPPGNAPSFGKWLDVHMLVLLSGRERTEAEYGALFGQAGFRLTQVIPTGPGPSIVEACPA
jgi:hypothetical protein